MGQLNKYVFAEYADFECDRQLLINIGNNDSSIILLTHKITLSARTKIKGSKLGYEKVQDYEQFIYSVLIDLSNVIYILDSKNEVTGIDFEPNDFTFYYKKMMSEGIDSLCLLEHQFKTSKKYAASILSISPSNKMKLSENRPDIILIRKIPSKNKEETRELLPDGSIRIVPIEEHSTRLGISIFDIKVTNESRIGKRHFIEIFYYAQALAFYLHENSLDSKYFVQKLITRIFIFRPFFIS